MRVHNFGAGPCTLPVDVLVEARDELLDFAGTGMSLIELSHRSPDYQKVHDQTIERLRRVASVPEDFSVLFIQGGATLQFGMIPMNLLGPDDRAGYVLSGTWGKKAFQDAVKVGAAYPAWDGSAEGYRRMPHPDEIDVDHSSRYLHVTTNETIGGIRMVEWPETPVPLVADMSSEYLARPIEWDNYDLIYGGVQKNLAPAGLAVVFIRNAAVEERGLPNYLSYKWHVENDSLGNTPPMFPVYIMGKVLERIEAGGGIAALEKESARKAERLYQVIDESEGFYRNPVDPACRSHMNVVFRLKSEELERAFLEGADGRGLIGLKGHRSVGGCRASLYAALSMESVEALVEYMAEFRSSH